MASRTSWPAIARQDGFGVVFPDGYNRAWADLRRNDNRAGKPPHHKGPHRNGAARNEATRNAPNGQARRSKHPPQERPGGVRDSEGGSIETVAFMRPKKHHRPQTGGDRRPPR